MAGTVSSYSITAIREIDDQHEQRKLYENKRSNCACANLTEMAGKVSSYSDLNRLTNQNDK